MDYIVKAVKNEAGEWLLDVLGVPFGSPEDRDADGEYFSPRTDLWLEQIPKRPIVYYHGYEELTPTVIGEEISHEIRADGVWFRVLLDKASEFAGRVWEAAQQGLARASSGAINHLVRTAPDGQILVWPLGELSIFDTNEARYPSNQGAIAVPVLKSIYKQAGLVLPDIPEPTDGGKGADSPMASRESEGQGTNNQTTESIMEDQITQADLEQIQADMEAMKAELDAAKAAKAKAEADAERQKEIDEAVKAAKDEWEDEQVKSRRLPWDAESAPIAARFGELYKYDNLTPGEQAFMINALKSDNRAVSDEAVKALAIKVADDTDDWHNVSRHAMVKAGVPVDNKGAVKANELMQSTLASYGDEWVGTTWSTDIWKRVLLEAQIAPLLPTLEVTQGESITIPLESTPPTFYKVAQASAQAANPGAITRTVTTSKMGTAQKVLSLAKAGAATYYTGEMEEDSMIPFVPQLVQMMAEEGSEVLDHVLIDGDTETSSSTNINDIAGTPAGTEAFMLADGFRKSCLVTTTANSRDGGAYTVNDFLETLKLLGLAGKNAMRKDQVIFISDLWTHWASLELPEVKTRDAFAQPTIENGDLAAIFGYRYFPSANMHRANQDATYGLKANTAGKVDLDTAGNNTKGALLAVRLDHWRLGWKRRMTIETTRVPSADATEIVAIMRFGIAQRDTEASAISYNLTV